MVKLACTHCGHQFELETPAGAVCPSCGWSSSVVKASDLEKESLFNESETNKHRPPHWILGFLLFCLKVVLLGAVIAGIVWAVWFFGQTKAPGSKTKLANPQNITVPETVSSPQQGLTEKEKSMLSTPMEISDEPVLTDQSLKLLQRSIDLQSTSVEKLPSASWSIKDFKEYIELQEEKFKIPLPRGYKKDLEDLFETTYATAYDLFLKGQLLQARDAYVASLAFPVYQNDLRKHRAVVLTMMRTFINDTIAKVGALNFTLARQGSQTTAEEVNQAYAQLQQAIRDSRWNQALDSLRKIETLLPSGAQGNLVSQAPPYGEMFAKVDADIQPSLLRLLQVPAWPFDINELKGDLSVKKMILLPLADPERKPSIQKYRQAMNFIQTKSWEEATELLKQVKSPEDLAQDADDKLRLIERIAAMEQDQSEKV